jgi:hypothetical protein
VKEVVNPRRGIQTLNVCREQSYSEGHNESSKVLMISNCDGGGKGIVVRECDRCKIKILLFFRSRERGENKSDCDHWR